MTDPDSILQLGIEAVREGNKEEARNLFRLLTSEDSHNAQAWLWLAGVAEDNNERRASLERVLELDPTNEMARKSLDVLQDGSSSGNTMDDAHNMMAALNQAPSPPSPPTPPPTHQDNMGLDDFDDPFAELDALSDVFESAPQAVSRTDSDAGDATTNAGKGKERSSHSSAYGSLSSDSRSKSKTSSSGWNDSKKGKDKRGSKLSMPSLQPKGKNTGNFRAIALLIAIVVVIMGLAFVVWPRLFGSSQQVAVQQAQQAQQAQPTAPSNTQPTPPPAPTTPPVEQATSDVAAETTVPITVPAQPEPAQPEPAQPEPVTGTAVQIISPNTPLESNNWLYDFNQQLCSPGSCAAVWYGNLGALQPTRGRFVTVLIMAANRTGQDQPLPADFLALKDSNGTVYNAIPQASTAYVIPGVNADVGHEQPIPANGIATSIMLVFDVPIGASQLVLYAPSKPDQGWLVMNTVN